MAASLSLELKRVESQLKKQWKKEYRKTKGLLKEDLKINDEFYEICLGLATLFLDAQTKNEAPDEVYGKDFNHFYANLLCECQSYQVKTRRKRKTVDYLLSGWMILVCVVAMLFMRYYHTSYYQITHKGLQYLPLADDYSQSSSIIDDSISFAIDLSDLPANAGKVIYDDGLCKIVLTSIQRENQNYLLNFESTGSILEDYAVLVSGERHFYDEDGRRHFDMNASLNFTCQGILYHCVPADMSCLNASGDKFSFELFSGTVFSQGKFKDDEYLQEHPIMRLYMNGLVKTEWQK